jgi:hypothetical protein
MDRKAALLLVSRALALIQGIAALIGVTYLPERLFAYVHYATPLGQPRAYVTSLYQVETGSLFVRILIYLFLAVAFWNCAPWVQNALLPETES